MRLTPQERDRRLIAAAAQLAHRGGPRLIVPETVAVVAGAAIEAARDGVRLGGGGGEGPVGAGTGD